MCFSNAAAYFLLLEKATSGYKSIDAVCNKTPREEYHSPDRLHFYMWQKSVDQVVEFTAAAATKGLESRGETVRRHARWGFLVAIDTTDVPTCIDDEYTHNTVKRKGSRYQKLSVRRYACISIVDERFKYALAILPVKNTDKHDQIVDRLLAIAGQMVRIRCVVMDKGFYNTDVLDVVERHGLHYLLPVKQVADVDLLYWQSVETGVWRWPYVMNRADKERR